MKADLKMRWLETILEYILNETESSVRLAALKQALQPFANGKMPPPATPTQQSKPTLASAEKTFQLLLSQLSASDKASLLSKLAPPPVTKSATEVVDRAASPVPELEHPTASALETVNESSESTTSSSGDGKTELAQAANISRRLKRKLTAVNAVSEPKEWQEYVKVGSLDVGCQTTFEVEQEASDSFSGTSGMPQNTTSARESSRVSASPVKTTPLTLTSLLGKNGMGAGTKNKKDRYQKINSVAVPRAISRLITSWRMNTDQLVQFAKKSLANVLKIIADAYSEMLTATRRKTQQQRFSDGIVTPWEGVQYTHEQLVQPLALRSNTRRRDSLPNFLFPDTARFTAKMSELHHPEAFDAPTIHTQFAYLLSHVTVKGPETLTRS
ncbi:unnamed protein product [Phytophthora lilii]|uniref:Unnamed protein product n=1 Tax=Phytophthora lilii TaxID=2077276 RepID=A0A9W7CQG6_9STRA|nr:unnamed protein product [Phytophthora lilii]